jgi:carbonic anhydrase
MELINLDERWTYKGSTTTPPCEQFVYWNVLSTVYPIKKKHLELIKIWI